MRISDWSSDVCSSDLIGCEFFAIRQIRSARGGSADPHGDRDPVAEADAFGFLHRALDRQKIAPVAREKRGRKFGPADRRHHRSEEHTSELQSLMRISYAVFCLKKKKEHIDVMILRIKCIHTNATATTTRT